MPGCESRSQPVTEVREYCCRLFIMLVFLLVSDIYRGSDPLEHTSSHFAAFFLTAIVMVFAAYVVYHNRQKV